MSQTKVDRRVQRTRQLLHDALVVLILEKGYAAVTVQDILNHANLGRSTFYAHYADKEDLLISGFESIREIFQSHHPGGLLCIGQPDGESGDLSLILFRHAAANHQLYQAIIGKQSNNMFLKHFQRHLCAHLQAHLDMIAAQGSLTPVGTDVIIHFLANSFMTLLVWWLDNNLPYTPEQMDKLFKDLVMPGMIAALGAPFYSSVQ